LIVTQAFLPLLGVDPAMQGKPGRIINMSSVSGKSGYPFLGAYVASKHALEGLSETLRRELMLYGIDVIIIGPGPVTTPIWDKAEGIDVSIYEQTSYARAAKDMQKYLIRNGRKGYPPEKVGNVVLRALTTARPRTRYAVIPGNRLIRLFERLLPKRIIDLIVARSLGLVQKG
jgi:NAD(P)-dependent dehydrogenase (short-subunit alcohol dehydrogenase family)